MDAVAKRDPDDELVMGTDHAVRVETEEQKQDVATCHYHCSVPSPIPTEPGTRATDRPQTETEREKACGRGPRRPLHPSPRCVSPKERCHPDRPAGAVSIQPLIHHGGCSNAWARSSPARGSVIRKHRRACVGGGNANWHWDWDRRSEACMCWSNQSRVDAELAHRAHGRFEMERDEPWDCCIMPAKQKKAFKATNEWAVAPSPAQPKPSVVDDRVCVCVCV